MTAAIETRGAQLPHLPDFNPIEHAFSKVTQALRRAETRTDSTLLSDTWTAFASITSTDAAGWFTYCGYSLGDRPSCNPQ